MVRVAWRCVGWCVEWWWWWCERGAAARTRTQHDAPPGVVWNGLQPLGLHRHRFGQRRRWRRRRREAPRAALPRVCFHVYIMVRCEKHGVALPRVCVHASCIMVRKPRALPACSSLPNCSLILSLSHLARRPRATPRPRRRSPPRQQRRRRRPLRRPQGRACHGRPPPLLLVGLPREGEERRKTGGKHWVINPVR